MARRRAARAPLAGLGGMLLAVTLAWPATAVTAGAAETGRSAPMVGGAAVSGSGPKVVLIVGPAGEATTNYRQQADAAAKEARRYTDNVTTLYSPNATWPAVRAALQGASVVVYLGHGNGWPSRYRNELFGATQNGMGLNAVAGGGDDAHEYFGEDFLARSVRLAPGAIVLLHHLCYASGNSEPGLPEGNLDTAEQRVDNFAAGWLSTGAQAVVAEGHLGPAYYVRSLLATRQSVETIWRASPTARGHILGVGSTRTHGAMAYLDPDKATAGFYRSLVIRGSIGPGGVNVPGVIGGTVPPPIEPSLARGGTRFEAPSLDATAVAGRAATLGLQVRMGTGVRLPSGVKLSVRWTPIASEPTAGGDGAPPRLGSAPMPGPSAPPGAAVEPSTDLQPPDIDLVVPEAPDQVIEPARAIVKNGVLRIPLTAPASPGLYRLVTTIHDADGTAFDAATQALIRTLIVRVTPALSAQYAVVRDLYVPAGASIDLPVRILNSGRESWGGRARLVSGPRLGTAEVPWLVARWLSLEGTAPEGDAGRAPAFIDQGKDKIIVVPVTVPAAAGEYLLILDLDVPGFGPLAARGVPPAMVRVHAGAPPRGPEARRAG